MIDAATWMADATAALKDAFGPRLLFVGLQGSYRRHEATEASDIDILVVLDRLSAEDLATYRRVLRGLPEGDKAGGFTCGAAQLRGWPKHELFQFEKDTDAWYGELAPLLPPVTRRDVEEGLRVAAANLYHFAANGYLTGDEAGRPEQLRGLYKSAFFLLQLAHYLRGGDYVATKAALAEKLAGEDLALLRLSADPALLDEAARRDSDECYQRLLAWCGGLLAAGQPGAEA